MSEPSSARRGMDPELADRVIMLQAIQKIDMLVHKIAQAEEMLELHQLYGDEPGQAYWRFWVQHYTRQMEEARTAARALKKQLGDDFEVDI